MSVFAMLILDEVELCVAYFAPDDPVLRSLLLCLGFVNVCYSLAKVEVCLWLAGNTVN